MNDIAAQTSTRYVAFVPAGMILAGRPVEEQGTPIRQARARLVRLTTEDGSELLAPPNQLIVCKRGRPFGPLGDPQPRAAATIQLDDHLCRPGDGGVRGGRWEPVTVRADLLSDEPVYRVDTDSETLVVNGFLIRTSVAYAAT